MTDEQWDRIFEIRCKSKLGQALSGEELDLIYEAYREDPDRYIALGSKVFEATRPFGF
jgi:hypothetical protein